MNDKISFICIDKRSLDKNSNQTYILLENGSKVILPPNVQRVPSLLCVKQQYKLITGDEILKYFHPALKMANNKATNFEGEPSAYSFLSCSRGCNIFSEKFTSLTLTPDELSAKGNSSNRPLYNYVSYGDELQLINTPDDTYKPDKISTDITLDQLQQKRMNDISTN
tara:strand:- start:1476 stop:1976 length:501 start_codon:yes stop_codon:yes gene_type:complete